MSGIKRLGLNVQYPTMNIYELARQQQQDAEERRNQTRILQITITKKPKNFSEKLEFTIKTNLSDTETVDFYIMDSDTFITNKGDRDDTELLKGKLRLNQKNHTIQFTEDMQKKAFKDTEFFSAECYIKIYHAKSGNSFSEVFDVEGFKFSKSTPNNECKKEIVPKVTLSPNDKKKFISTVLCESQLGNDKLKEIAWVYHNRVRLHGVDTHSGLRASNPFREKLRDYKLCSYYYKIEGEYLKYGSESYDKFTIKTYLETKDFKERVLPKFKNLEHYINTEVLIDNPQTCFKDWEGQGYWGDLDMNPDDKHNDIHDPKWYMARQYYWLQNQNKVSDKYIHIMRSGSGTTFIFHEKKIAEYFKKYPNMLPKPENVRKFQIKKGILEFD